jgi:hypothetical protein
MDESMVRRWTAWAGVLVTVSALGTVPLYFMYDGPPPSWNVLARALATLLGAAGLVVFFTGFRDLVRRALPSLDWPASLFATCGTLLVAVSLLAAAHEAGVVYGAPSGTLDPTIDGPLAQANILLHGSVKRLLMAMMLLAGGFIGVRARLVPRWNGWFAYAIALCNLAFVPSMFASTDVTRFYGTHGWGNSAFCGSLIVYWILATSIALLNQRSGEPLQATPEASAE